MPQKRVYLEMNRMKRGKPRKWETQILVGELSFGEEESEDGWLITIDKCLSPLMVQNVAYKIIFI